MTSPDEPHDVNSGSPVTGAHGLGPHVVGTRIVVRRLVPGETGPTGGPAFTDLLGVAEGWWPDLVVRRADGTAVTVPHALIVSGKPVPPRASRLQRVPGREVQRRVRGLWPGETATLGDWLLQVSPPHEGRVRRRANSVLAYGSPDRPLGEALVAVEQWYAARDRPPELCVPLGSAEEAALRDAGWTEPPDFAGHAVAVQVGSVARLRRALGPIDGRGDTGTAETRRGPVEGAAPDVERVRASVTADGHRIATGLADLRGDWACVHDVRTDAAYRRTGLARHVVAGLLGEVAERGVTTVVLHVLTTNAPALALYAGLGFEEHHTATYLAPRR
ncbi:GNAT family N-acetyltransferase [Nocardioides zeae]|uniref:GNAT superfamily N-acetyltransferase n=1 Tax=Nocardioides zeae TaxID=1457234 RepID=A0AAJ1U974_9ACTN|nr:GNAT family N-acetyltransferase [Nocardioides zeae]MDQ1106706.1 GNAT superfamily N-acetyltransferase [Nocardioides zeae]